MFAGAKLAKAGADGNMMKEFYRQWLTAFVQNLNLLVSKPRLQRAEG
ncbi:hypothetical protein [Sporomusa termitida]|nr:hypothetical protein [Sporomusa termitida]